MSYENPYLIDFAPIFFGVIKEKGINPAKIELIVFDEEAEERHIFERVDVLDVLNQLCENLNALTIYTERPDFFTVFAEKVHEETGLLVIIVSKQQQNRADRALPPSTTGIILDFERNGSCYSLERLPNCGYIPIHKRPWKMRENLDCQE